MKHLILNKSLWTFITCICLFFSCTKEKIDKTSINTDINIEIFQNTFTFNEFNNSLNIIPSNTIVNWEIYNIVEGNGISYYEFKTSSVESGNLDDSEIQQNDQIRLVSFFDENDEIQFFIIKLKPLLNDTVSDYWYLNPEGFSGTAYQYDYKGELIRLEYWENDSLLTSIEEIETIETDIPNRSARCALKALSAVKVSSNSCCLGPPDPYDPECGGGGGGEITGSFVPVTTYHYTDWYKVYPNGTLEYTNTIYEGSTTEYVYVGNPFTTSRNQNSYRNYLYSSENGSGGSYSNSFGSDSEPERITTNLQSSEKANCINGKLVLQGFVAGILDDFKDQVDTETGEVTPSDIDLEILSVPSSELTENVNGRIVVRNASTKANSETATITIKINESYAETAPSLELAKTILHEYIHAEMYKMLADIDNPNYKDFFTTYDAFKNKNRAKAQHESMAHLYVNTMSNVLRNFHETVLMDDYNEYVQKFGPPMDDFYEALSWVGLKEEGVEEYDDLSPEEKLVIDNELEKTNELTTTNPCN